MFMIVKNIRSFKQDHQFWRVALWRTHYNGCYIKLFYFPCYGHRIPNLSVIRGQMHGTSMGIYQFPCILYTPVCSTTCQYIWFKSRIKPCSFNISFLLDTKESPYKRGTSCPEALKNHLHSKSFLIWCVPVSGHWSTIRGSLLTKIFNQTDMHTPFGPSPKCWKRKIKLESWNSVCT